MWRKGESTIWHKKARAFVRFILYVLRSYLRWCFISGIVYFVVLYYCYLSYVKDWSKITAFCYTKC